MTSATFVMVLLLALLAGCGSPPTDPTPGQFVFNFRQGQQGWTPDAARYYADFSLVTADYRPLEGALASQGAALFAEGLSFATVPFMYFKRRVSGLSAGRAYRASFSVEIGTNTPSQCGGPGASPGEGTYVKAGATTTEPLTTSEPTPVGPFIRYLFDPGYRSAGGANAVVLGNIANTMQCPDYSVWQLKSLQSDATVHVVADSAGSVWLLQAVDPGFEGRIRVYFTRFSATLVEN